MSEKDNVILTAVGPDKVGLVEKISEFIVQHGCNIEDSKMAVFCGEFALILLISGAGNDLLKLANAYQELGVRTGLNIWIKSPSRKASPVSTLSYRLTAACLDRPGVVHKLSSVLSLMGINIESMETKTYAAPISGTPIFRLEALLSVPTTININSVRSRFGEIQKEENIDVELSLITNL
ncbi:MAG: glycine cleavage system protein R [Candidatus Binatia bacterium]